MRPSTKDIINSTSPDPITRPPAPIPKPEYLGSDQISDEDYDEPDQPFRQASVASIASHQWPAPYDEIRVRFSDTPPAIPPERKQTNAAVLDIPRTTSFPAAFPEVRRENNGKAETSRMGESTGHPQSLVSQKRRALTLASNTMPPDLVIRTPSTQPPDVSETKRTSHVIPPPPRTPTENNPSNLISDTSRLPKASAAIEQRECQYSNMPLPRSSSDKNLMPPSAEAGELCDSNRPGIPQQGSRDSTVLDSHGYIKIIP